MKPLTEEDIARRGYPAAEAIRGRGDVGRIWLGRDDNVIDPARVARTTDALMEGMKPMSWSVRFLGKPAAVVAALEKHSETLTGQSLEEYNEAKPALITLVKGNVGAQIVDVTASGHASFSNGEKTSGTVSVTVAPLYGQFVVEEPQAAAVGG